MNVKKQSEFDSMLGRIVVEKGLASAKDVQDCLDLSRELAGEGGEEGNANERSLADLLVSNGIVTARQLDRLRPTIEESRPAQQIPGFQMLEKLGAGAMATVYKAKQLSLDRVVAVKVLPLKFSTNAEFVQRFYAEGRAAAKLNHPNIVQAIDVGQAGDFHYFVMEYVEGKTVYDDLKDGQRYDEKTALDVVIQIARALEHAHEAGFIHRDVKPKNIMITHQGVAKLADMGLARAVSDREAAEAEQGKAYGTPYYISPEQIRGEVTVDFRCDIYGLGATFYHMVTGRVPYDAPNPSAVMHKHLKAELTPPDHINPQLSTGIGEIIEVCMAKDPASRYASTSDLLTDLEAVARGEAPIQARKKFDLASLSAIEKPAAGDEAAMVATQAAAPLLEQPVFWIAVAGWAAALVFLILMLAN